MSQNDEFCIQNEECFIQNEECFIQNDGFCRALIEARRSPLPAGFAEAYTLSGCTNTAYCGTFWRVAARCDTAIGADIWTRGYYCPGGAGEYSGSMDPSLCNGVPVYQKGGGDGAVLYRGEGSSGRTGWIVGDSSALETCGGLNGRAYLNGPANHPPYEGPPTAPAYSTETGSGYSTRINWDSGE